MIKIFKRMFFILKRLFYVCRVKNIKTMEEPKKRGRKKIIGGIKKQIICTKEEFEEIKKLLKEIRINKTN